MLRVLVLFLLISLAGCYATGSTFAESPAPPATSEPIAYFYRQPGYFGGWIPSGIFIDGKRVDWMGQKGFTWIVLAAGAHEIGASWGDSRPEVGLATLINPGKQYFRLSTHAVNGGNEIRIDQVPEAVALEEMKNFRYSPHK